MKTSELIAQLCKDYDCKVNKMTLQFTSEKDMIDAADDIADAKPFIIDQDDLTLTFLSESALKVARNAYQIYQKLDDVSINNIAKSMQINESDEIIAMSKGLYNDASKRSLCAHLGINDLLPDDTTTADNANTASLVPAVNESHIHTVKFNSFEDAEKSANAKGVKFANREFNVAGYEDGPKSRYSIADLVTTSGKVLGVIRYNQKTKLATVELEDSVSKDSIFDTFVNESSTIISNALYKEAKDRLRDISKVQFLETIALQTAIAAKQQNINSKLGLTQFILDYSIDTLHVTLDSIHEYPMFQKFVEYIVANKKYANESTNSIKVEVSVRYAKQANDALNDAKNINATQIASNVWTIDIADKDDIAELFKQWSVKEYEFINESAKTYSEFVAKNSPSPININNVQVGYVLGYKDTVCEVVGIDNKVLKCIVKLSSNPDYAVGSQFPIFKTNSRIILTKLQDSFVNESSSNTKIYETRSAITKILLNSKLNNNEMLETLEPLVLELKGKGNLKTWLTIKDTMSLNESNAPEVFAKKREIEDKLKNTNLSEQERRQLEDLLYQVNSNIGRHNLNESSMKSLIDKKFWVKPYDLVDGKQYTWFMGAEPLLCTYIGLDLDKGGFKFKLGKSIHRLGGKDVQDYIFDSAYMNESAVAYRVPSSAFANPWLTHKIQSASWIRPYEFGNAFNDGIVNAEVVCSDCVDGAGSDSKTEVKAVYVNESNEICFAPAVPKFISENGQINSADEFKEYAKVVLKEAHGDDYDESIADKTISGILDKYDNNYGAMVGALTSGFGK